MPTQTTNLQLYKPLVTEGYDVEVVNANTDKIDAAIASATADGTRWCGAAGGSGNAFTVTVTTAPEITAYENGMGFAFYAGRDSSAPTLKVGALPAIPIKKGDGTTPAPVKTGVVTVRYYNGNFFLANAGGAPDGYGTAIAGDVLEGKTVAAESGLVTGTMPNNETSDATITTQGGQATIETGYHNGSGKVTANITALGPENVRSGANVGGILGTFSADATAVAAEILAGKTAYKNGAALAGTMPNNGALNVTPTNGPQHFGAGYYSEINISLAPRDAVIHSLEMEPIVHGGTEISCPSVYEFIWNQVASTPTAYMFPLLYIASTMQCIRMSDLNPSSVAGKYVLANYVHQSNQYPSGEYYLVWLAV